MFRFKQQNQSDKNFTGKTWFLPVIISLSAVIEVESSYWHPDQVPYVGDFIKLPINKIKFCEKDICIEDASRMALWMNESADPCKNIYQYVCGSFLYYQALNERYISQGLQQILYDTINEQRRKALADPIRPTDIRAHKIAKSMFQKCVDSEKVRKYGTLEFMAFVKTFGGFPMLEEDWDSKKFNLSQLLSDYPTLMTDMFQIMFEMKYDSDVFRTNFTIYFDIVFQFPWELTPGYDEMSLTFKRLLKNIGIPYSKKIDEQLNEIKDWMEWMWRFQNSSISPIDPKTPTIGIFNDYMNCNLTKTRFDWKRYLNFLLDFEVDDDFPIKMSSMVSARERIEKLDGSDARVLANFISIRIMIENYQSVSVYFRDSNEKDEYGTQREPQRFEKCVKLVKKNVPQAFTSLLIRKFTNKRMMDEAKEIANRTMNLITKIVGNDETIPIEHRTVVVEKLKSIKLILGYPDELLDDEKVKSLYKNLKLKGDESLIELMFHSRAFNRNGLFKQLVRFEGGRTKWNQSLKWANFVFEEEYANPMSEMESGGFNPNSIYFPSLWFQPPYFDADRPRYYQDALFAVFLANTVKKRLQIDLDYHHVIRKGAGKIYDFISAIFEKYAEWDDKFGEDLPLPGFLFSNKQLFWLTLIHKNCYKIQPGAKVIGNGQETAQAYFSATRSFQEAFGCTFSNTLRDEDIQNYNNFY